MDLYEFEEKDDQGAYGLRHDDYEELDEPNFEKEVKAFERVGKFGKLSELISDSKNLSKTDRFLIAVSSFGQELMEQKIGITEDDLNIILTKTEKVQKLEFKNAKGFVLGFYGTKGGKGIDARNVTHIFEKILPKIKDSGVEKADVIRYCRFWNKFL